MEADIANSEKLRMRYFPNSLTKTVLHGLQLSMCILLMIGLT